MTKTPRPDEVDRLLGSDAEVVGLLADLVEQKTRPTTPPAPRPRPPAPKPKPPTRKAPPMRRRSKATTEPKPTRSKVRIHLADDIPAAPLLHEQERQRSRSDSLRTSTTAHDVKAFTPCRVCGGGVSPSGDRWGPWREHRECARIATSEPGRVTAAARVLGVCEVSAETARLVRYDVPTYRGVHPEPVWFDDDRKRDRGAWAHVDRKALLRAIADAEMEREEQTIPRPCEAGPCAWCGVEEALGWTGYGHHRADGSEAPLCSDCSTVYERRWPSVQFWEDQRPAIAEALTGAPLNLGEPAPAGLLAHAETEDGGDGSPWSHLRPEAVEAFRWAAWEHLGGKYAPPEHKAEAAARYAAKHAQRAAQDAAREHADTYGFSASEEAVSDG